MDYASKVKPTQEPNEKPANSALSVSLGSMALATTIRVGGKDIKCLLDRETYNFVTPKDSRTQVGEVAKIEGVDFIVSRINQEGDVLRVKTQRMLNS